MFKYKIFNNIFKLILVGLISVYFISCSQPEEITILNQGDDTYASIQINNSYGNNFVITSSDKEGSFGFIINGETNWIKGQPKVSKVSETVSNYVWEHGELKVHLKTEKKKDETNLEFKLEGSEQNPSAWMINTKVKNDEYFTGIFERVVDGHQNNSWEKGITTALNLRGEKVDVKLKPTVSAYAPFYISSGNYAVFVRGTWPGVIDFCKEQKDMVQISFEGPEFSFSLMKDKGPAELIKRHALETGPSFVPPKWAFGPWRWRDENFQRDEYYDGTKVNAPYNSEIVEEILLMQKYDIPVTAYWIDRPWGPGVRGFDDYNFDYERLPNFENTIKWLDSKNIATMLWIGPFVMGEMADYAEEKGYYLESNIWRDSRQVLMDFTNEEGAKWWGENGPAKLAKLGVKGFKLDRADGEKLRDSLNLKTSIGTTYRENFNDYPRQYVKAAYEGVKPTLGEDFVLFPRAQYTGSAKYGALWAGDTGNPQEGLRSAIIALQRCSVMGYPIWGSDAGGYPKELIPEVTKRWIGFACFSPIMEIGPTNNCAFWAMNYEPSFDKELLAVWRFYSKLRMDLIDYTHEYAKVANKTGMPVVRPLFVEYPDQKESWENWETYKYGEDLLVSIIWEEGKTKQSVYLPVGETWIDLWSNKEYEGGKYIEVDSPVYHTPIFLRKGSKLQLPDLNKLYEESVEITSVKHDIKKLESAENWLND